MSSKRKHKVSSKVLAALAKGRAMLKAKRRGKKVSKRAFRKVYKVIMSGKHKKRARRKMYVPPSQEPLIITKGECMSGRRRGRKTHRKSFSGEFMGRTHRRRRSRRSYGMAGGRRRRRYYGGERVSPMKTLITGAVAVGGGVAASMAAHYIPIANPKAKAAIPILLGMVLASLPLARKNKMVHAAAIGSVVVGAMSLVRQMAPNVPLLTGDMQYYGGDMYVPQYGEQAAMLGYPAQMGGELDGESVASFGELDGAEQIAD